MDQPQSNSGFKIMAVVAVLAIAVYTTYKLSQPSTTAAPSPAQASIVSPSPIPTDQETEIASAGTYTDGVYQVTGNYVSPGGPREIEVSLTLANGIVTSSTFEGSAEDPASKRFQGEFADNYQSQVIGRSIDEINLTKVSGSSLTPIGFNDAVAKIKQQAQV